MKTCQKITAFICVMILFSMFAAAEAAVKVKVEKKGTYIYWLQYKDINGADVTTIPDRFKGIEASIKTDAIVSKIPQIKLNILDKRTGNLAISQIEISKDKKAEISINLKSADFTYIPLVKLRVITEDGAPLESALVKITDGMSNSLTALVTPADEGVAVFHNVASGEINVNVESPGLERTMDSDIEISEDRTTPAFTKDIKVAGDVKTISAAPVKENASKPGQSSTKPARSAASGILQMITGFIFVILVVVIIVVILKAKGVNAKKALSQMGMTFPDDSTPAQQVAQTPAIDPNICPFCGQRKDASGMCSCSITPGASPFQASAPSSEGPRLIGTQGTYSGHIFLIKSSQAIIGREASNEVALPNDSTASRRHAVIIVSGSDYMIRDEGSSNGTFVNGAKITEQKLAAGDEVMVGGTKFRFEV